MGLGKPLAGAAKKGVEKFSEHVGEKLAQKGLALAEEQVTGYSAKQEEKQVEKSFSDEYLPYQEVIDYMLQSQNMTIASYQQSLALNSLQEAYAAFFSTYKQDVLSTEASMMQNVNNLITPSQPGEGNWSHIDHPEQDQYVQNSQQQYEFQQQELQQQRQQIREELSQIKQELKEELDQKLDKNKSWYEQKVQKIKSGPRASTIMVLWIVYILCYIIDAVVGLTPYVGDMLALIIIMGIWAVMAIVYGKDVLIYAAFFYLGDVVLGFITDPIFGIGVIIDFAYEIILAGKSPPSMYKHAYKKAVKELN